jgi:hypothetical protein
MSKSRRVWLALIMILAGIQLLRPAKTNPVTDPSRGYKAHLSVTPEVARLLDRSCSDCHSDNTVWPWYSNVAPVSWVVIDDVQQGRRHLNLSDWAKYPPGGARDKLRQICKEVKEGSMPLREYLWAHRDKRLTPQERAMICEWTAAEGQRLGENPTPQSKATK